MGRRERAARLEALAVDTIAPALIPVDRAAPSGRGVEAAVLIALYDDQRGPVAVFTERSHQLRKHAGEISFPGGRRDAGESLQQTAIREAEEEIGLADSDVEVMGALPPMGTFISGFRVYPFVARIPSGLTWTPSPDEVAKVLEIPLAELAEARVVRPLLAQGVPIPTVSFTVGGHLVWGATGRILDTLLRRL